MTVILPEGPDHQTVTERPAAELERIILGTAERPCAAAAANPED